MVKKDKKLKSKRLPKSNSELIESGPKIRRWLKEGKSRRWIEKEVGVDFRRLQRLNIVSKGIGKKPIAKIKRSDIETKKTEVQADIDNYGVGFVKQKYHVGSVKLREMGFTWGKRIHHKTKPTATSIEDSKFKEVEKFPDIILSVSKYLRLLLKNSKKVEPLEKNIAELEKRTRVIEKSLGETRQSNNTNLEQRVKKLEDRARAIVYYVQILEACFGQALNTLGMRKGIQLEFKLPALQHLYGRGADGKRKSFNPDDHFEIIVKKVKTQKHN